MDLTLGQVTEIGLLQPLSQACWLAEACNHPLSSVSHPQLVDRSLEKTLLDRYINVEILAQNALQGSLLES